jgi:hypothetical protein
MNTSPETLAWAEFIAAAEVDSVETTFARLLATLSVDRALRGKRLFDAITARTAASTAPYRTKEFLKALGAHWARRPPPPSEGGPLRVVISGAGPVGLRMAADCPCSACPSWSSRSAQCSRA